MRILLEANHRYPAGGTVGTGLRPNPLATGGASLVHDWLAKGLAMRGHEVFYLLPAVEEPLPDGVVHVIEPPEDVDVFHHYNSQKLGESVALPLMEACGVPWLTSCHNAPCHWGGSDDLINEHWVFVSRSLAERHGSNRWVLNGIDPAELIYSEDKADHVVFICNLNSMDQATNKGLDIALELSCAIGFDLVVLGSCRDEETLARVAEMCATAGADFRGDVRGPDKARLLARARALLFPSRLDEAFGLVLAEALMSGTPVITSEVGACREIVAPGTGFVCATRADYGRAFAALAGIEPATCRSEAMARFHFERMAADFEGLYNTSDASARERRHLAGSTRSREADETSFLEVREPTPEARLR